MIPVRLRWVSIPRTLVCMTRSRAASLALAAALSVPLLSACGGGGSTSPAAVPVADTSSDTTSSSSTTAAAAGTDCASLVGQAVDAAVVRTCTGGSGASGSGGCYPNGKRDGTFYWINYPEDGSKFLYGRAGGKWSSGPKSMTVSAMAKGAGC
jgi:hypothetical protein